MPTARIHGAELYYEERGSTGDVVVSAHQLVAPDSIAKLLADDPTGYHTYEVEVRGFGRSSPSPDLGLDFYYQWADDLAAFASALALPPFVYVGVSHGAGIGWHLALQHPDLLTALVSIVGAPQTREGGMASPGRQAAARAATEGTDARRTLLEKMFPPTSDRQRLERRTRYVERAMAQDPASAARGATAGKILNRFMTDEELYAGLAMIRVPTLILGGALDALCPPEVNVAAARMVVGAKCVLWQDQGHQLVHDSPELAIQEIQLFVDELHA